MKDYNKYRYLCDNFCFDIFDIRDNVVYADGRPGRHITKEIIPNGIAFLKEFPVFKGLVLEDLNGADVFLTSETPYEKIEEVYQTALEETTARKQAEHEAFLKTPEGKKWLAEQEEKEKLAKAEKAEHDAFVFHSEEEVFEALKKIKPCDLTSNKTSVEDAVRFCKEVMTVLLKCEDLCPNHRKMEEALTALGACRYDDANKKFKTDAEKLSEVLTKKDNIEFPLSVLTQIIGSSYNSYKFGLQRATDGGKKYSWVGEWLSAQSEPEPKQPGQE